MQTKRPLVIAAIMASTAMVALEATIVSTAMPQIVSRLGGLNLYSWVFATFLLTQTAMTVVFGKLADLYGRKPMILAGVAIFLIGSVLAGFAQSMPAMLVYRLIQGVGAGAIMPVAMTIVGDLYPAHERGKIQGYLASVWATSAVFGPMAGSLIISVMSWSWIFWINVPIGLLAAVGFVVYLHEETVPRRPSIDFAGAALFTLAIAALMMALTDAESGNHVRVGIEVVVLVISSILFVVQERRAADPIVSFRLWSRRLIAVCNIAALFSGMVMIGLTAFLPMYVQIVLGRSPVVAGLALTMMMVGWPAGATIAAKAYQRIGLRRMLVAGGAFVPLGVSVFVLLAPDSHPAWAGVGSLVLGFGMGLLSVGSMIVIQDSVVLNERGSATASNLFSRNLGNTVGASLLGAIQTYSLARSGAVTTDQLRRLLDAPGTMSAAASQAVRDALQHSLHLTFTVMLVIALAVVGAMLLLPAVRVRGKHETVVME